MKDQPNSISFSLVKYRKPFVSSLDAASATSSTDSSTSHSSSCSNSEVENILNTILPPKGILSSFKPINLPWFIYSEFEEDGLVWKQQVSSKETVRKDVESLKGALDNLLIERQARDTGICQVWNSSRPAFSKFVTGTKRAVCSMFWWIDTPDYHYMHWKRSLVIKSQRWSQDDSSCLHGDILFIHWHCYYSLKILRHCMNLAQLWDSRNPIMLKLERRTWSER